MGQYLVCCSTDDVNRQIRDERIPAVYVSDQDVHDELCQELKGDGDAGSTDSTQEQPVIVAGQPVRIRSPACNPGIFHACEPGGAAASSRAAGDPSAQSSNLEVLVPEAFQVRCKESEVPQGTVFTPRKVEAINEVSPEISSPRRLVSIHIYDLRPWLLPINSLLKPRGFGMFHVGVEVWGEECTYGANGVEWHAPRKHPAYRYRESHSMGYTKFDAVQWQKIRNRLQDEWQGAKYHLLDRNCVAFVRVVCEELGVLNNFPEWVSGMATQLKVSHLREAIDATIEQEQERQILEKRLARSRRSQRVKAPVVTPRPDETPDETSRAPTGQPELPPKDPVGPFPTGKSTRL